MEERIKQLQAENEQLRKRLEAAIAEGNRLRSIIKRIYARTREDGF